MPKKEIDCKEILRLHSLGMSQNRITKLLHISKRSASDVIKAADNKGIDYKAASGIDDHSLYRKLFPDRRLAEEYRCQPHFKMIHDELSDPGATLRSCWNSYKNMCELSGTDSVQYSTFCAGYARFCKENSVANRALFRPGMIFQFTWAPKVLEYSDSFGNPMKAYLFVGLLPFSGRVFAKLTEHRDEDTFIRCIGHAFIQSGGVPGTISVLHGRDPDAKRLRQNEVIISEKTVMMAAFYRAGLQKENTGLADLAAEHVLEKLNSLNGIKNIERIENSLFRTVNSMNKDLEKDFLTEQASFDPVPEKIYDVVSVSKKEVVVQNNSHVKYDGNFYSAPWQYRGKGVQVRYTDKELCVFYNDTCIAKHQKVSDFVRRRYVTEGRHMPPKEKHPEFDKRRLQTWAGNTGANISEVVRLMFERVDYEEQAYNTALSLLQTGKTKGYGYLDKVCEKALKMKKNPSYATILQVMQDEYIEQTQM